MAPKPNATGVIACAIVFGFVGWRPHGGCSKSEESDTSAPAAKAAAANAGATGDPLKLPDDPKGEAVKAEVATDARVELLAVIERLAKAPPYSESHGGYASDIDATFGKFAEHPAVDAARKARQTHGISYNAPIDLATHLETGTLKPIVALEPPPAEMDQRWKGADGPGFATKVAKFASDTPFKDFLSKHAGFYKANDEKLRQFVDQKPIVGWYEKTFGPRPKATFRVAPSAAVGTLNFGSTATDAAGNETVTVVINLPGDPAATATATLGDVAYEVLAHEFGHAFVNPIVDEHWSTLEKPVTALLKEQKAAMDKLAYGAPVPMARESVNRAVVLLFLSDRSTIAHRDKTMNEEVQRGFVWTPKLVSALHEVRKKNGGKLPANDVAETTRRVFQEWADTHGG